MKKINFVILGIILVLAMGSIVIADTSGIGVSTSTGTLGISSSSAATTIGSTQYYNPIYASSYGYTSPSVYWPAFDTSVCRNRQDFIIQVAPAGCEPAVVRSDLLEEQPVPVFCKLMMIQTNPLIDVARVRSITFQGKYPDGVQGVTYFPSDINLLSTQRTLADTPLDDNMGYFVVQLKKYNAEKEMPDWVSGNLSAVVYYDTENVLGTGNTYMYVPELSYDDWLGEYKEYGFWNGKGYIKVDSVSGDSATISVYRDLDTKISTVTLKRGATSDVMYLPGFYCAAGLKITLSDLQAPVNTALLQVDNQQVWVARGDTIADGQCRVNSIDPSGNGGRVSVSCSGAKNGRFDLSLNPGKVSINLQSNDGNQDVDATLGEEVKSGSRIYLGYVGSWQGNGKNERFAIFVFDNSSDNDIEFGNKGVYSAIDSLLRSKSTSKSSQGLGDLKASITSAINNQYSKGFFGTKIVSQVLIVTEGQSSSIKGYDNSGQLTDYTIKLSGVDAIKNSGINGTDALSSEYYQAAIQNYKDLYSLYPNEKKIQDDNYFEPYAAEGLYRASQLSGLFGMNSDRMEFLNELYRDYPSSTWTSQAQQDQKRLVEYDSSISRQTVSLIDGRSYSIQLLDIKKPDEKVASADMLIDGKSIKLGLGEIHDIGENRSIQITDVEDTYINVLYSYSKTAKTSGGTRTVQMDLNKNYQVDLDGTRVKLTNINLMKQAKLLLGSDVQGPMGYANFSFKIGIEKRGIQLSPEKTKEMIDNIGKSIKEWTNINDKLGKVVSTMKGACFATAAVLTVKNMFDGMGGKSMARSEVMTSKNGWNDYCSGIINGHTASKYNNQIYTNFDKCLLDHSSFIENDVNIRANEIENTNKILEASRQGLVTKTDILDFQGTVKDETAMENNFKSAVKSDCLNWQPIALPPIGNTPQQPFNAAASGFCDWGTFEDMKQMSTLYNTINTQGASDVLKAEAGTELATLTQNAKTTYDMQAAMQKAEKEINDSGLGIAVTNLDGDSTTLANIKTITQSDKAGAYTKFSGIDPGSKVMVVSIPTVVPGNQNFKLTSEVAGHDAIVKLKDTGNGIYTVDKAYAMDGTSSDNITKDVNNYLSIKKATKFTESNAKAYQNKMINPESLMVKYFDQAPFKGKPAEVPFDVNEGWYVEMEYITSGFGKPYDENGAAVNFYICNVGPDGLIEYKQNRDDICRYYNSVNNDLGFPGMDSAKSRALVTAAQNAIRDAVNGYGKKTVSIRGLNGQSHTFNTGTSFGGNGGRCSDFMSPSDCNIMFNVCDPVICPSSRCNLGGEFTVDNVIQTGIIGSLVLCLPNINEGIYIPVCLSGVHAGIEGYVSILNSTQSCLNESLTTGKNIGICDEIKSIYTCEFFWKQIVPFVSTMFPKLIQSFFSQGTRGGGEYLTVQSAWDNMQSSINYFKNQYAINSMQAFNMRSIDEAGTDVCKASISTNYPTNIDVLTQPDSPVQYTAWFDESVMTTATPIPTSDYKVYYHIYAGQDSGAYYIVYLKDIPLELTSQYTYTSQEYVVDRGYVAKGGTIDQAKDFTGPAGYKQLCLNINGQDQCGFGKVSTSFAVNYLSDVYAADQASQNITTSSSCVAGNPSLLSLAQPNLEAGTGQVLQPELYNQGIVRVCSTYNPEKQVNSQGQYDTTNLVSSRWQDVGYCDDPSLRCWLDTQSVKQVITDKQLENQALAGVSPGTIGQTGALTTQKSLEIANQAQTLIDTKGSTVDGVTLDITGLTTSAQIYLKFNNTISQLNQLANFGPTNADRARGLFWLGRLYDEIARQIYARNAAALTSSSGTGQTCTVITSEPSAIGTQVTDSGGTVWTRTDNVNYPWKNGVTELDWTGLTTSFSPICKTCTVITQEPTDIGTQVTDSNGAVWTRTNNPSYPWSNSGTQSDWTGLTTSFSPICLSSGSMTGTVTTNAYTLSADNKILINNNYTGIYISTSNNKVMLDGAFFNTQTQIVGDVTNQVMHFNSNIVVTTLIPALSYALEGATLPLGPGGGDIILSQSSTGGTNGGNTGSTNTQNAITDDMLRQNVQILCRKDLSSSQCTYKFYNNWILVSTDPGLNCGMIPVTGYADGLKWISENCGIIDMNGYFTGTPDSIYQQLVSKLLLSGSGLSSNEDWSNPSLSSQYYFEFQDGTLAANTYFRYNNGAWEYSMNAETWESVGSNGAMLRSDKDFFLGLNKSSYAEGIVSLVKRVINNDEGSFFARFGILSGGLGDTGLVIYKNGKAVKSYAYNDAALQLVEQKLNLIVDSSKTEITPVQTTSSSGGQTTTTDTTTTTNNAPLPIGSMNTATNGGKGVIWEGMNDNKFKLWLLNSSENCWDSTDTVLEMRGSDLYLTEEDSSVQTPWLIYDDSKKVDIAGSINSRWYSCPSCGAVQFLSLGTASNNGNVVVYQSMDEIMNAVNSKICVG